MGVLPADCFQFAFRIEVSHNAKQPRQL